jgi:hypothetical protein
MLPTPQEDRAMATDFEISVYNRPGTLAEATAALGAAGVNIDGQCSYVCEGRGVYHILVSDAVMARRALIDAGFDIHTERRVVVAALEDRPGATAAILRVVADRGVNIDLAYVTASGGLVLGGSDPDAIARAIG